MQKPQIVFWVLLSASGCAKDPSAARPAQDPGGVPPSDAGTPPPDGLISEPVTSAVPPGAHRDPLLEKPAGCGAARPNPHGVTLEWMTRRDGSCGVCEAEPAPLKACAPGQRVAEITAKTLQAHRGQRVNVAGSLSVTNPMCTKRGGPCACNNRCSAPLWLSQAEPETPLIVPTSKAEPLSCAGDEGGLCCPFAMPEGKRSVEVVVSGTLVQSNPGEALAGDPTLQLEVETICAR